ncbi:MAG: hypothetical protein II518_04975 [Candidatus Methanomethylophilus sp.]|nr:hypothetical protein [Methanomethylophilus sp.]
MRQPCLQCLLKHIGNAAVLIEEVEDGYPYSHMVVGHLDQAAQEIRGYSKEFALVIRAHRIKWQQDHDYSIPFEAFDRYVGDLELLGDLNNKGMFPHVPEDCYEGLDKLASGEGYNLMTGDQR